MSRTLDIPTQANELITVDFADYETAPASSYAEVWEIIRAERAPVRYVIILIEEIWRRGFRGTAWVYLTEAIQDHRSDRDRIGLFCMRATYGIALARMVPREILKRPRASKELNVHPDPEHPNRRQIKTKQEYWNNAQADLESAKRINPKDKRVLDGFASLHLARGALPAASQAIDAILSSEPHNIPALLSKARILYAQKSYTLALKSYQQVLMLDPNGEGCGKADPRIGIGCCFWEMGDLEGAKRAWERASVVNPNATTPQLLLGMYHLNASKSSLLLRDLGKKTELYEKGMNLMKNVFLMDQTNAMAARVLGCHFLDAGDLEKAMKLTERALQFSSTRQQAGECHLQLARILHRQDNIPAALEFYNQAKQAPESKPGTFSSNSYYASTATIASLGISGLALQSSDYPSAQNSYEDILRKSSGQLEASVGLASVVTELMGGYGGDGSRARETWGALMRTLKTLEGGERKESNARTLAVESDWQVWVEVARVFEGDSNATMSCKALAKALELVEEEDESADSGEEEMKRQLLKTEILSNLGVAKWALGTFAEALGHWEAAVQSVKPLQLRQSDNNSAAKSQKTLSTRVDAVLTTSLFNLGVGYEVNGQIDRAEEVYGKILEKHPEYLDAKARLALLAIKGGDYQRASALIKETLASSANNPRLRSLSTYFLYKSNALQLALDFTVETLKASKQQSKQHVYALCAVGWLYFTTARESRPQSPVQVKDRDSRFLRAAECFDKALKFDSQCAYAAIGLGICIAEGRLPGSANEGAEQRSRDAKDALGIFLKAKECLSDASIYVNMGHCFFCREEWGRAIESYETASTKYHQGKNVGVLLYLAMAWYHKAMAHRNFADLGVALEKTKEAQRLSGVDDEALQFNVAILLQRGLEILIPLEGNQRTVEDLELAVSNCENAINIFEKLASSENQNPPYPKDLALQRQKHGSVLIKKAADTITLQREFERRESIRLEEARVARQTEKDRVLLLEEEKREERRKREEQLADQRRLMKEEAVLWSNRVLESDEDEKEKEKKKKRGDKKRSKKKEDEEEGIAESSEEDEEKPKAKKIKKQKQPKPQLDEDGEEMVQAKRKSNKVFKSAEFIDSDEE